MDTLSYGYKRPANGDTGATFWDNLSFNITRYNGHSHNGVDSAQLTSIAITVVQDTTSLVAANWVLVSGGLYRTLVTVPASITYDGYGLEFQITNGTDSGYRVQLASLKVSNTTFYVYSNDATINVTILFTV